MPGVLIIEALAQISGILSFLTTNTKPDKQSYSLFAGIEEAKFKRVVLPGDQLRLESKILRTKFDIWFYEASAFVGDELACSAKLKLARGVLK